MKTLKREEINANTYRDLDHLRANIAAFIEQYHNQHRPHSLLGHLTPTEFVAQRQVEPTAKEVLCSG